MPEPIDQTLNEPASPPPTVTQPVEASTLSLRPLPGEETVPTRPLPAGSLAGLGRFRLQGEIGRGGMGAVLHGHDPALGRELAIKVLLEGRQASPEVLRRFLEEAQIGGQLQHPGVVPVYEVGHADGRPYFAMKLVRGRTLAAMLAERKSPADDLPRFLGIFEQICQALAYAHARGVIHRDLKPANVMVGAFGEVQVMDWGLAKLLASAAREGEAREGEAREGEAREGEAPAEPVTPRSAGASPSPAPPSPASSSPARLASDATHAGSVLGTPAYMAPEQARGEIERVDERADVFGLGAILCQVLTGTPPFVAGNVTEVLARSAGGDLSDAFARLDGCGADAELIALAKGCLAPDRHDRPRDAKAVAERVSAYRIGVAERLHRAEVERAEAMVREAAERRSRQLTLALAGVVLLAVVLGGSGGFMLWQQRRERLAEEARIEAERKRDEERRDEAIGEDIDEAEKAMRKARWVEARAALDRAGGRLSSGGSDALRYVHEKRLADLKLVDDLEEAWLALYASSEHGDNRGLSASTLDREGTDRLYAKALASRGLDVFGGTVEEAAEDVVASPVQEQVVLALDRWARVLRGMGKKTESARLDALVDRADRDPWRHKVRMAVRKPDIPALIAMTEDRRELLSQPAINFLLIGEVLLELNQNAKALICLSGADSRRPGDFWTNLALGHAAMRMSLLGGYPAGYYSAAVALKPDSAAAQLHLAYALHYQSAFPGMATSHYNKALKLKPDWLPALINLGRLHHQEGNLREAEAVFAHALRVNPRSTNAQRLYAWLLRDLNRLGESEGLLRKVVEAVPDFAPTRLELAEVLRMQGKSAEALAEVRRAQDAAKKTNRTWSTADQKKIKDIERQAELDARLPAFIDGKVKPAGPAEQIELALLCALKKRTAASARFYADAFTADMKLAESRSPSHRYLAACQAALAGTGQGIDGKDLPEKERVRWLSQARDWLRAELAIWDQALASGKPQDKATVRQKLEYWLVDVNLAAVREEAGITQLPAEEREPWRRFWRDVDALLARAKEPTSGRP